MGPGRQGSGGSQVFDRSKARGDGSAVAALELRAQGREVIAAFDDRHASQPLVLEGLDDTFRDGEGSVLSHGALFRSAHAEIESLEIHSDKSSLRLLRNHPAEHIGRYRQNPRLDQASEHDHVHRQR